VIGQDIIDGGPVLAGFCETVARSGHGCRGHGLQKATLLDQPVCITIRVKSSLKKVEII
jgi:hypothetical protein